ncbi:uncharacterized protein EI90DRAFT_3034580 [Cantharellus anzutake]|uniref:uncharacterized protein n=1 Tax=Cantharellus anzutake TaxID=1750568 RepID=UPI0019053936|nr:uncharacterized protein EI90DRAFT_3034580 [Cantharellus anzutake]KAF8341600.1 hypothetical protein EI90DRAFT_3034580 [Cantharellus anzutake]
MRFWNAVIPLALLPIVAADFHALLIGCAHPNYPPEARTPYWTLYPSDKDSDICAATSTPQARHVSLGAKINVAICGGNITVSYQLGVWSSTDGRNGICSPVNYGGGIGQMTSCVNGQEVCLVFDTHYCTSDFCNGGDGSG